MIYGSDYNTDVKPVYFPFEFHFCKELAFKAKVRLKVKIKKDVKLLSTFDP